jgi:hypothetical protein
MTLAITAIVAAAALSGVVFATPQQVMAGGNGHRHHDNNNGIRVDQQVNQQNQCSGQPPQALQRETAAAMVATPGPSTLCVNQGNNSADVGH